MGILKKSRLFATASVFSGVMMLLPQTAFATNYATVTFMVIPPAGGTNDAGSSGSVSLSCGWHVSCVSPYPGGTGVDWVNGSNHKVFLRAKVIDSLVIGSVQSVYAKVSGRTVNGCPQVVAQIWGKNRVTDTTDDERVMNVVFMHTLWNGTTRTVNFTASRTGDIFGVAVGTMHDDTNGGCSWRGLHVHSDQESVSGFTIRRNTADIPNAAGPCPGNPSDPGACNTFNGGGTTWKPAEHWERKVAWSYCYSGCPL